MSNKQLTITSIIVSSLAHILAYIQFNLMGQKILLYQKIVHQFRILIIISLFTFFLISYLKDKRMVWILFIFRGLLYFLITVPLNGYVAVALTLITTLIFESFVFLSLTGGLIYSPLLIFISVIFQQNDHISFFKVILPTYSIHDSISFCAYAGFIIVLSSFLSYYQSHHVTLSELNDELNEATANLAEANVQLQEYAVRVEEESAKNERKIVAREIHDSLAYTLTNIIMMAEAGIDLVSYNRESLEGHLKKIRIQAKEGLDEVRSALKTIRAPLSNKVSGLQAVKRLVDSIKETTKIEIELIFANAPHSFASDLDKTIYRLVQEGLTNAIRHGRATRITIYFFVIDEILKIWIEDNGIGCDDISIGYGLLGMRERIEGLGGTLEATSKSGDGYILSACIPLKG